MTSTETLITKVANAEQGHDSLGPTGLTVHLTPAERDEAVAALTAADKYRDALEQIALLDEADGHELGRGHAFQAVAIATTALGKSPSAVFVDRYEGKPAPAPLGRAIAMHESAYIAGAKAGFNLGVNEDHEGLAALIASRDGYLKGLALAPAPPAQSGAGEARKITGLTTIAAVIRSWLDWDKAHRDKEFLTTDGDTAIMSLPVPFWPSHACFENWISTMIESADRITTLTQALAEAEKMMEPFDVIASTKGGTPQAEKLSVVICAILEQTPNGDLGALNEFCGAILAARAWLKRNRRAER